MEILEYILAIVAGLITAIPLVIKLIEYVKKSAKEKNWSAVMAMAIKYMEIAEDKFATGSERKEWVLATIQASAEFVNYDIDLAVLSDMIDALCAMSKVVNGAKKNGEQ